ncbi:MAG: ATP-binding protein [Bacteroidetes bacterium]|nr:ATP-binding protein [Bacteroidota bacterium]
MKNSLISEHRCLSFAMKFHNRENELEQLNRIEGLSREQFFFLRITGRRRIGKTELIREWIQGQRSKVLYFYVTRQNEATLLSEFKQILAQEYPEYRSVEFAGMSQFIQTLFDVHIRHHVITIFDEFQEFQWQANDPFSIIQKELDQRLGKMKGLLVAVGSLQSMMTRLFDDAKQPLFGRLNASLHCTSFTPRSLEKLFDEHGVDIHNRLDLYTVFHGIPFYYKLINDYQLWNKSIFDIIGRLVLDKNSILVDEGRQLLLSEFGKNYAPWFSILKAVSSGSTRLSEIVNQSGVPMENINRYLNELIRYYQIIERRQPLGAEPKGKISRYYISDRFIEFWFRFVYRYQSMLEIGASAALLGNIERDFAAYQGKIFEEYCKELLIEQNQNGIVSFDEIGSWWDRGTTEIDIITINHRLKTIVMYECKLQGKRYKLPELQAKASRFIDSQKQLRSYGLSFKMLGADQWAELQAG